MIWSFDLDDTISSTPDAMAAIMRGLRAQGHQVHVVSGTHHAPATQEDADEKAELLESLGCGDCYDALAVISGPEKRVADGKVNYMRHVGSTVLVDNRKQNIKAVQKAGFLGLRHFDPKLPKHG